MTRILIVEDKEENLYYLRALLGGHGFAVDVARHGAEALIKARQNPPGLVVSDLLMPVMDGYTLLRHWKVDVRLKRVPFVVYTATYTEEQDEQLALSLGADAFILKPCEPEEFLRRIHAVISAGSPVDPGAVRALPGDEKELLKVYSETLIRKLEEKTLQLEESNRALQLDNARRQKAEEELRESEERFRVTFEQAAVGIAHVDPDGRFMRVNAKLSEMTGYTRDELLARTIRDLTVPEDVAEGEAARQAMVEGRQQSFSAEKRYQKKGGAIFWVSVVTTLLRDGAGQPKYFISVLTDVTERRALQEQFLRAQRLEGIGTLAGGIAHDLNNLLAPVALGVGLLRLKCADEASLRVIESIERSANRGTDLVRQVLSFARGVEGARVAVHFSHVAREIQGFVRTSFPKNINFAMNMPKDLWLVAGDPTQLNQVLLNLCVNARDAMPAGGTLRVEARNLVVDQQYAAMQRSLPPGRYVQVKVIDTGTGIAPELQDRIFEPFFTTKEPGKGTGLGLSTVLGIVRSHGGLVSVESEPGKGSTFCISLPAQADLTATESPATKGQAELPRGNNELVLLVDDDASVLAVTRQTLETFGYRVLPAEDGAQAMGLYAMNRAEVALVLLDMMMPIMDGPALINALRRINPDVRIIATSGQQSTEARALSGGARHFLPKPYSAEALLRKLAETLAG